MTLMEMLREAGYPEEDFDHHESDLYVYRTPLTTRVINEWLKENGFTSDVFVEVFTDNVTGRAMYDIVFQYDPYWENLVGGI